VLTSNRCKNGRTAAWRGDVDECWGRVFENTVHGHYLEEVTQGAGVKSSSETAHLSVTAASLQHLNNQCIRPLLHILFDELA
jgi:hypothetical protein